MWKMQCFYQRDHSPFANEAGWPASSTSSLWSLIKLTAGRVPSWPACPAYPWPMARGLCACLVHPNNMGKGTTRSNRCEFIKRWAISGAQREVYFNLHTNCSHWFAQRAATTTTATTTRKAEGIRHKALDSCSRGWSWSHSRWPLAYPLPACPLVTPCRTTLRLCPLISVIMMMADLSGSSGASGSSVLLIPYKMADISWLLAPARLNFWPMVSTAQRSTRWDDDGDDDDDGNIFLKIALDSPLNGAGQGVRVRSLPVLRSSRGCLWSPLVNIISQLIFHFS